MLSEAVRSPKASPTPQMMPDAVGSFGEKKKLCSTSPTPDLSTPLVGNIVLVNQGHDDGAGNDVPVRADEHRNDRLNVQHMLAAFFVSTQFLIIVVLEWRADHRCNRIQRLLRQLRYGIGFALGKSD